MVGGRLIVMKTLLYYLSISIILTTISYSKNVFSKSLDSNTTLDGRWRGIVVCDDDKEKWGGGEYKLGNGKLSGKIDFTVSKGTIKAGNHDYPLFACSKSIDT